MRGTNILLLAATAAASSIAPRVQAANPIVTENAKAGDGDWRIDAARVGTMKSIDAYPSRFSVKKGDTLGLRVSTIDASFRTRIYRLGWYRGAGARLVIDVPSTKGEAQPVPVPDLIFGLAECGWRDSVTIAIDERFVPGVFLARVTGIDGLESQTYFVVRDDGEPTRAPLLFVVASATHQAYNSWPKGGTIATVGKSLYDWNSNGPPVQQSDEVWAVKVSFDRPFAAGAGAGDLLTWEYPLFQFIEQHGYDVAYATSADVDEGPVLSGRLAIVEGGHDEYWSFGVFDHLQAARDAGVSLAFFTGDIAAWQVRFEPSKAGDPRGVMSSYKEHAYPADPETGSWLGDPYYFAGQAAVEKGDLASARYFLSRVSGAWAELESDAASGIDARRPGMALTGVQHGGSTATAGFDWVVRNAAHWIYGGTGLRDGDLLRKLVGYEWDNPRAGDVTWDDVRPEGQVVLAQSPTGATAPHGASYYDAKSGAGVFTAGTIQWAFALAAGGTGATPHDDRVETITTNVLDRFVAGPGGDAGVAFDAGPGGADAGIVLPVDAPFDAGDVGGEVTVTGDVHDGAIGSAIDAGPRDATVLEEADDAGNTPIPSSLDDSGCGCRLGLGGRVAGPSLLIPIVALVTVVTRRRRGDGPFRGSRVRRRPGCFKGPRVW
jgi:hypothetical protein